MSTLIWLLGSFDPSSGRNHLIAFTLGLLITFLGIRANTRLIRADVRWWFHGSPRAGDVHIHHMVVGIVAMVVSGLTIIAFDPMRFWGIAACIAFGGGVALTLDEFGLILHLEDVYWQDKGRISVDAVIVTVAVAVLVIGGLQPFAVGGTMLARLGGWAITVVIAANMTLAAICFLKGKLWTGILGCFIPVVALVGAVRLARPGSPWARRYRDNPVKRERAERRDQAEAALVRAWKTWFFDLIAGKPHVPPVQTVPHPHLPHHTPAQRQPLGSGHPGASD